jgi:prepilin-type N-terminal cleavage/methylation domain-containing protein
MTTSRRGYTMIELLVVVGVIGILATASWSTAAVMRRSSGLGNGIQELVSILHQAQAQSIAGQGTSSHTLRYVSASTYSVLSGSTVTNTYALPSGLTFASAFSDIVFTRLSGTTNCTSLSPCTISFVGSNRQIQVTATGVISTP